MFRSVCFILAIILPCSFPLMASDEYSVGFSKIEAVSKDTSEDISIAVVYPTFAPAEAVRFGPFGMELAVGAVIAESKFPGDQISGTAASRLTWSGSALLSPCHCTRRTTTRTTRRKARSATTRTDPNTSKRPSMPCCQIPRLPRV